MGGWGGHATASWNISCRGQRKDRASSPGVLPLNETGGKLTYRVIVTNIAEEALSAALPPSRWGRLKNKKKGKASLHLRFVWTQIFSQSKKKKKKPQESAGRIPPRCTDVTVWCAAAAGLALERGQLERRDEMEKFQCGEHVHAGDNWRFLPPKDGGAISSASRSPMTCPRYSFSLIPARDITCEVHLEHKGAEQEPTQIGFGIPLLIYDA